MATKHRFKWDVFVSHNGHQKNWVRGARTTVEGPRACVFFDEDSIDPGEDIIAGIERGLIGSRHVVLVITPTAVASRWVAMETASTVFSDPDSRSRRLIPVLLEPTDYKKLQLAVQRLNWIDLTDPATRLDRYHHLLKFLKVTDRPHFPELSGPKEPAGDEFVLAQTKPISQEPQSDQHAPRRSHIGRDEGVLDPRTNCDRNRSPDQKSIGLDS